MITLKNKLNQIKDKLHSFKSNNPQSLRKKPYDFQKITGLPENNCTLISRWGILAIIIIILVFMGAAITSFSELNPVKDPNTLVTSKEVIGNDSRGMVTKEGPYGNFNSPIKIAYILGLHPRESRAHNATMANIRENSKSLKQCYYLYYINVTNYTYDYSMGRMNGQKLAYKYIVPDVNKNNYSLAIDVHASNGRYTDKPFVFVPTDDYNSLEVTKNLLSTLKWLHYYSIPIPAVLIILPSP